MAKEQLGGGRNGKPFSVDVGMPQRRFYLGHDRGDAERRKTKLHALWARLTQLGWSAWDEFSLDVAMAIRQGKETMTVDTGGAPDDFSYRLRIDDANRHFAGLMVFVPTDTQAYGVRNLSRYGAHSRRAI